MPGYFGFTNFEQDLDGYGSVELHLPSGINNLKGFDLNYQGVEGTTFDKDPSFSGNEFKSDYRIGFHPDDLWVPDDFNLTGGLVGTFYFRSNEIY